MDHVTRPTGPSSRGRSELRCRALSDGICRLPTAANRGHRERIVADIGPLRPAIFGMTLTRLKLRPDRRCSLITACNPKLDGTAQVLLELNSSQATLEPLACFKVTKLFLTASLRELSIQGKGLCIFQAGNDGLLAIELASVRSPFQQH